MNVSSASSTQETKNDLSNFNCLLLNARSLKSISSTPNKLTQFQHLVYSKLPSLVAVTETWLTNYVYDSEILPTGYNIFRRDRVGRRGGGVLLACRDHLSCICLPHLSPDDSEILVCELEVPRSPKIAVIVAYRPPSCTNTFLLHLEQTLKNIETSGIQRYILLGDFNFPSIDWHLNSSSNVVENGFCAILDDYFLTQLVGCATHRLGNLLDLVLTNFPESFSVPECHEFAFDSDHLTITFGINLMGSRKHKLRRTVYNFKKANFDELRSCLADANLDQTLLDSNINTNWSKWLSTVTRCVDTIIPKVAVKNSTSPPWIDSEILHLSNKKETLWRRTKRSGSLYLKEKLRKLTNNLKNLVESKYYQFINNARSDLFNNPKRFWSIFQTKTKSRSLPKVIKGLGQIAATSIEKANLFNKYFFSVFNLSNLSPSSVNSLPSVNPQLSSFHFTISEVRKILESLDVNKAIGPDGLSPRILRECALELSPSLCLLFNKSLSLGIVPAAWKEANVTPVHKKDDKDLVDNYRPISLLSCVSKVMERCLLNRILPFLEGSLYHLQHGFLKGKSCTTQMVEVLDYFSKILDNAGQVDVLYLDYSKAFDSVPHSLLIHKLKNFGINSNLLKWIRSYLTDRRQRVVVEGSSSDWLPVASGVPQCSILGPFLFLLYVNDLPSCLSSNSTLALFADDSKCYKEITSPDDCLTLQQDIDSLLNWSEIWGMSFNTSKCKILRVTRSSNPCIYPYSMGASIIAPTQVYISIFF